MKCPRNAVRLFLVILVSALLAGCSSVKQKSLNNPEEICFDGDAKIIIQGETSSGNIGITESSKSENGEFSVTPGPDGLAITLNMNEEWLYIDIHVFNITEDYENARISVDCTKSSTRKFKYPFVKLGDEYQVYLTMQKKDYTDWTKTQFVKVQAEGGLGNFAVTKSGFSYDNDEQSVLLKDLTFVVPKKKIDYKIEGNIYCNGAWNEYYGWYNDFVVEENKLFLNKHNEKKRAELSGKNNIFVSIDKICKIDGVRFSCKILENTNALFNPIHKFPLLKIVTDSGEEITEKNYYPSSVTIDNCDEKYILDSVHAGVRVRGNSTADFQWGPEVPYRIKFDEKQKVLGLHDNKKFKSWVLLESNGSYSDYMGFKLAEKIFEGEYYSSDCTFVHVYINDVYKGIYLLCEQNQVNKRRVDITEPVKESKGPDCGYLLEMDNYANAEDHPFFALNTEEELPINDYGWEKKSKYRDVVDINGDKRFFTSTRYSIKVDTYSDEQNNFIAKYLRNVYEICWQAITEEKAFEFDEEYNLVESKKSPPEAVENVIDLKSFANTFILQELVRNNDVGAGSFFMAVDFTKNKNERYGRLTFEAPWDFNWGYQHFPKDEDYYENNGRLRYYAGAYQPRYVLNDGYERSNYWFVLFNKSPWFRKYIRERWNEIGADELRKVTAKAKEHFVSYQEYDFIGKSDHNREWDFVNERIDYIEECFWKE